MPSHQAQLFLVVCQLLFRLGQRVKYALTGDFQLVGDLLLGEILPTIPLYVLNLRLFLV